MEISQQQQEEILQEVIDRFLIPRFKELKMSASGEWERSVQARGNEIWGRDYTEYLEQGRPPNEDQSPEAIQAWVGWAGSTFLADWVANKGLSINPYAVAQVIARNGTDSYPEGRELLEVLESKEVEEFIAKKLTTFVTFNVQLEFKKMVKGL